MESWPIFENMSNILYNYKDFCSEQENKNVKKSKKSWPYFEDTTTFQQDGCSIKIRTALTTMKTISSIIIIVLWIYGVEGIQ